MEEIIKNQYGHGTIRQINSTISDFVNFKDLAQKMDDVRTLLHPKNSNFYKMIRNILPSDKKKAFNNLILKLNDIMGKFMIDISDNYGVCYLPNVDYFNDMYKQIKNKETEMSKTGITPDPKEVISKVNPHIAEEIYKALEDSVNKNLESGKKCGIEPPPQTKVKENN